MRMTTKYETNKGILIEEYDEGAQNPREWNEYYSKFVTFQRGYHSPDKHDFEDFDDLVATLGKKSIINTYRTKGAAAGNLELIEYLKKKGIIAIPVYKYDHSGCSYSAAMSNPYPDGGWDSGMVGIIYAHNSDIAKAYCVKRVGKKTVEKVIACLEAEVEEYSYWAQGEAYCYTLQDSEGNEIDSCCGFYGPLADNGALYNFGITEYKEIK